MSCRAESDNSKLSILEISGAQLRPAFAPGIREYVVAVPGHLGRVGISAQLVRNNRAAYEWFINDVPIDLPGGKPVTSLFC